MSAPTLTKRQQKTRVAFMNAFLRLVMLHGIENITVTDIANEADYGRWTFYQYFESREDVAWATFVYWMTQLDAYVVEAVQHLPSPQREYESWRLIFQAVQQQKEFFIKLDSLISTVWYTRAKEFLIDQFLQHIHEGRFALMEGVRPAIAARLYVTSVLELMVYWGRHPDIGETQAMVDEFFVFIFKQKPPQPLT